MRYLWLRLIPLFNYSCKDEPAQTLDIFHTWEAKEFISIESFYYPKIEGNKIRYYTVCKFAIVNSAFKTC